MSKKIMLSNSQKKTYKLMIGIENIERELEISYKNMKKKKRSSE